MPPMHVDAGMNNSNSSVVEWVVCGLRWYVCTYLTDRQDIDKVLLEKHRETPVTVTVTVIHPRIYVHWGH